MSINFYKANIMEKPATKYIFISHKRDEVTTPVAELLYKRIKVNLTAHGFAEPFFDMQSIEKGDIWDDKISHALAQTTHFIGLLSDDYWLSEHCQRELQEVIRRYEQTGSPRLLFVLTERMDLRALELASNSRSAKAKTPFPTVENLGQINFLGPYDKAGRLVALNCTDKTILGDQLFDLLLDIKQLS